MPQAAQLDELAGWKPVRMHAIHRAGAGWEIDATFENGQYGCVLDTSAVEHMFAYAPWLGPFTPQAFRDMIGRTLTQMADAWNDRYATDGGASS